MFSYNYEMSFDEAEDLALELFLDLKWSYGVGPADDLDDLYDPDK